MTNKEILEQLSGMEVQYPYCDWESLRKLGCHIRHTLAANPISPKFTYLSDIESEGIDWQNHIPEFDQACYFASKRFGQFLDDENIGSYTIADEFKVNVAIVHKMRYVKEFKMLPLYTLEKLCYDKMHITVHNMFFGEDIPFNMPIIITRILCELEGKDSKTIKALVDYAESQYREFAASVEPNPDTLNRLRPIPELLCDRLEWYVIENRLSSHDMLGRDNTPPVLQFALNRLYENRNKVTLHIQTCMQIALTLQIPLDFFLCDHFTDKIECYMNKNGKPVLIKNKKMLKLIDCIFAVDKEHKDNILAKCFNVITKDVLD